MILKFTVVKSFAIASLLVAGTTLAVMATTSIAMAQQNAEMEGLKLPSGVKDMPATAVKAAIDKKQAIMIFDANGKDSYAKHRLPGAKQIAFNGVTADKLPQDKSAALLFYCANEMCPDSHMAAEKAVSLGYKNVSVIPQCIEGWVKAGYPVYKS